MLLVETMSAILDTEIACGYGLVTLGLSPSAFFAGLVCEAERNVEISECGAKAEREIGGRSEAGIVVVVVVVKMDVGLTGVGR